MIQIQSVLIFRKGTATQLNWSIQSYERNSTQVQVAWVLLNANDTPIESGAETFGEEVTSIWTENDEPIDNALLGALGLVKSV